MKPVLKALAVEKRFGGVCAVQDVNFEAQAGKIFSIIGPNGAGKTTLFNVLSGIHPPDDGKVFLNNESIAGLPTHEVCRRGLARTFQNIRLFGEMTVLENVLVGNFSREQISWLDVAFRTKRFRDSEQSAIHAARELLNRVGLLYHANLLAKNLSYGFQRRLEIARALATRPKVLLLDEPGAGMNPTELGELTRMICEVRDLGLAVLLIEHHMKVVMDISDEILVLDHGEEIARGKPSEISAHPEVVSAYLGESIGGKEC